MKIYHDHPSFCQHLLQRLPELAWRIPYWPKNYKIFIYPGLFQLKVDWQPQDALNELAQGINALSVMSEQSSLAKYLSQKILKQIEALVKIGQEFQSEYKSLGLARGLTRAQYLAALKQKKQHLQQQEQALLLAKKTSEHALAIQAELDILQAHLQQVEKLLTSA